jgi:uroporphyrinogen-III synthase
MGGVTPGWPLAGLRVGLLQARYVHELAALIEREGAVPLLAPCMREVRNDGDDGLRARLIEITEAPVDVFVFQTGVGTQALLDLAEGDGLRDGLAERVEGSLVVARGPKPLTVLLRHGFRVDRRTPQPHTTRELIGVLDMEELAGRRVAVQHYGTANQALTDYLRERGAEVVELFSYRWALPDDVGPVHRFLRELAAGRLAVTAFTSASQVENLFIVAADAGVAEELAGWLNQLTVTAAIGPTCAGALEQRGVAVAIQPEHPKMVPLVRAIREHFAA